MQGTKRSRTGFFKTEFKTIRVYEQETLKKWLFIENAVQMFLEIQHQGPPISIPRFPSFLKNGSNFF